MTLEDWSGTLGVSVLLIAFALNLLGFLDHKSRAYQGANALGAGILAWVAWRIEFMPFFVLELVWCMVSLLALFSLVKPRA